MALHDLDIARRATLRRITDIARERLGIADEHLVPDGHYKAQIAWPGLPSLDERPDSRLSRMHPT